MGTCAEDKPNISDAAPGGVGLVLIDVINPMDFEGAEALASSALDAADVIARLRDQADQLGVPVVYVNDNYGHWGSDEAKLVEICGAANSTAKRLIGTLARASATTSSSNRSFRDSTPPTCPFCCRDWGFDGWC
jgi:hypothetical protein